MFVKKGIALKMFVFTSFFITAVVLISFGILYVVLPDFYFASKSRSLEMNARLLASEMNLTSSEDDIFNLIRNFCLENNSEVMVYNSNDELLVRLSSPFNVIYSQRLDFNQNTGIIEKDHLQDDKKLNRNISKFTIINNSIDSSSNPEQYTTISVMDSNNSFRFIRRNTDSTILISKEVDNPIVRRFDVLSTVQPINEAQNVIISLIPYLIIVVLLITLVAAYFYAKMFTRPIVALSNTAAKMQQLSPDIISGIRSKDEIGELSENLDLLYLNLCSNIENLQREMNKVSILEKSKTDFMRAASHELKTPIAALNGIVEGMIDNVGKYKDKEKYLNESKKLIDNIAKLISEILNASRLDMTEGILQLESVDIRRFIELILENYQIFIDEKKLDVSFIGEDFAIYTDSNVLGKTLSNIISNAVKYTDMNGIVNIITLKKDGFYSLSIENQCPNIPHESLCKLFEPFYTHNYSRNRSISGTGLGLYIVKRNLEILQLDYSLENTKLGLKFSIFGYIGTSLVSVPLCSFFVFVLLYLF